jgi:CoA:oxalate CoA-transferase
MASKPNDAQIDAWLGPGGILKGIRVIDVSQLIAGPWCASILGQLGADVIKVEPPGSGDLLRGLGPQVKGESVLFLAVNQNKRSLALNLGHPKGRRVLERLLRVSDVIIQNFRPDVRKRFGLDYQTVQRLNSKVIYVSVTGFGEKGPYTMLPAVDHVIQGMSGLMSLTGWPDGPPVRSGVPLADMVAGLWCFGGVLTALLHRCKSGHGQKIEVSLLDAAMSLQQIPLTHFLLLGKGPDRSGNSSPYASPATIFETSDGYVSVAAFTDRLFVSLCKLLSVEELASDPRFNSHEARLHNRRALEALLAQHFQKKPTAFWVELLARADIPCGPVNDYPALLADPQVLINGLIKDVGHRSLGQVRVPGVPIKFSSISADSLLAAPLLGEHTEEIMGELGFGRDEIEEFEKEGVVSQRREAASDS